MVNKKDITEAQVVSQAPVDFQGAIVNLDPDLDRVDDSVRRNG
jgi:hypothetical protein